MKTIYQNAWNNSFAYNDYLKLVDDKIEQKLSTGREQNELLTDFTKLNRVRMKRLDKTQQLLPEVIEAVKRISEKQLWMVLTESWCGDAA
ncbi:MAG TPA: thioredoxin family protein, partial [Flavobacterium sp.]|nr:thioredoxin family protein [Flavobacterium sp.]